MNAASPHDPFFKAALTDKLQDFFLIDLIILLHGKVDELKQQIVDVQAEHIARYADLFIEIIHTLADLYFLILLDRPDQIVQAVLT